MSSSEEKSERPSEVKLKDARNKGQVAKSTDVVLLASLLATSLFLFGFFSYGQNKIASYLSSCYALVGRPLSLDEIQNLARNGFHLWLFLSLPILLAAFLGTFLGNVGQIGFLLTSYPLKPDLKRINPVSGLKKLVSKDRLIELIKQIVKFALVFFIIAKTIRGNLFAVSLLSRAPLSKALLVMADVVFTIFIKVLLGLSLLAAFDYLWQRYSFLKSMRMSRYELKKEHKQQEGDPFFKSERKRLWREALGSISQHQVKNSSVVVVNPSHLAVALLYDEKIHQAPIIIAKGLEARAKDIIREASHNHVPVIRNVCLAKDLWWLDLNEEIPEKLFHSVAELLTFIDELSAEHKRP